MSVTTTVWWSKNALPNVAKGHEDWEQNRDTGLNKRSCTTHTTRGKWSGKKEKWVRSPFHTAVAGASMWQGINFLWFFVEDGAHSKRQNGWLARGARTVGRSLHINYVYACVVFMQHYEQCQRKSGVLWQVCRQKKGDTYHVRCLDVVVSHFHGCTSDEHRTSSHVAVVWAQACGSKQLISTVPILHKVSSGFVTRDLSRGRQSINQTRYLLTESYKCFKIMIVATQIKDFPFCIDHHPFHPHFLK